MPRPHRASLAAALIGALAAVLVAGLAPATALAPAGDPPDLPLPQADRPSERVDRTFPVGTLNILGSQHTRGPDRRRSRRTARLIEKRGLAVIGLQEVQHGQLGVLRRRLEHHRVWPAERYGPQGLRLQVAWRKRRFDLRDHGSIITTFSHQQRPVPWVRLKDRKTGRAFSVIVVHNSPSDQERARDTATREEVALYLRLRERGPVVIVGDANERREWFCRLTGKTDARAANGGRHRERCRPPSPTYVDWIMGRGRFEWRDYRAQEVGVSDHLLHTAVLRWQHR